MSQRVKPYAVEIPCPVTAGAGTSFTEATCVRLVNTDNANSWVVNVEETAGGGVIGSFTMPPNTVEYLEKVASHTVFAGNAAVLGAKVGLTN